MNNTLKYIHMDGRIIFDVMNEVKKGHSLESYKLDNVASNFIRGKILKLRNVEYEDNRYVYFETNSKGTLKIGDYISFNIKNNYGDMKYNNGGKYYITNIRSENGIYVIQILTDEKIKSNKLLKTDDNDILYSEWCLNKDDISPQELFDKHKFGNAEDRGFIAKYCIMDCELCIHLLLMLDFIPNNIGMSNVCFVPQPYIFLRGQGIKVQSIVTKFSHINGYKIPTLKQYDEKESDNSGFEGAIVLEPKTGIYLDDPIAVVDYASLYPSSIIEKNISHDTYLGEYGEIKDKEWFKDYKPGIDYNRIEYDNYIYEQKEGTSIIEKKPVLNDDDTIQVIDCVFLSEHNTKCKKKKGIIPRVLKELLGARSATKKLLKEEKDENKKKVLDGLQTAYKLTANSVYGQMGAKTSCLLFKKVAACTTAIGRQKIIDAKKYAYDWALLPSNNHIYNPLKEEHSNYEEYYNSLKDKDKDKEQLALDNKLLDVVYGDTDSIFIKFSRKVEKDKEELVKLDSVEHSIQCGQIIGKYITSKLKEDSWPEKYWDEDKTSPNLYPQDLEYEKTFYPFILISKKRYTGEKYEFTSKEIPKRTSMGLVTKRRDNAPIVKYVFGNMVNKLMNATNVEQVISWLEQTLKKIADGKEHISMFLISKTLNSYYKNPDGIAHKVLADKIGERDPGNRPKANDRIPYLFVKVDFKKEFLRYKQVSQKKENGHYKNGKQKYKTIKVNGDPVYKAQKILQGDRIEHPDYMDWGGIKKEIDYSHYISNQIMNPVKQLLDISIDPEETSKLFNSFIE